MLSEIVPNDGPKSRIAPFISYAREDSAMALKLCRDLASAGCEPWLDVEKLRGGQNWEFAIRNAIRNSTHFIALISEHSVNKRGYVQKELAHALEILAEFPPDEIFVIPLRTDSSSPRHERLRQLHWIDLFPEYPDAFQRLLGSLAADVGYPEEFTIEPAVAVESGVGDLNPQKTFVSFVVGPINEIAHAASLAVALSPARTYNPLFIYGGVGLGKTHLLQAISQYVMSETINAKVMYLSCELFINEFVDATQHGRLSKFRKRYRQADLLLIDDIHFLAGKERCQEEFFHTFNTLFDRSKQIVLSSDRSASEIENLEHRLASRFESGLTVEVLPPDVETRSAILRQKARSLQIKLKDEVFDFLATRIRTNVRRLEGALMRVASFASLSGKELTAEVMEDLLKDMLKEEARHPSRSRS